MVATCVANNPPVQQWFLEGGVMPHLMAGLQGQGTTDDLVLVRVKALLAMSGMVSDWWHKLAACNPCAVHCMAQHPRILWHGTMPR